MKKILLGTTAMMTAGLIASGANAEGINLSISGYYTAAIGMVDIDAPVATTEDDVIMQHEGEISFAGSTTLDNGLTVGAEANLEMVNNNRTTTGADDGQFDEVFAYVEGSFGRVEIGENGGAAFQMHITAPYFVASHGADSPNFSWNATTSTRTSSYIDAVGDTMKVTYFTPVISGFQLGVSYTPESTFAVGAQSTNPGTGAGLQFNAASPFAAEDNIEVGATFSTEVEGIAIGASAGYATGDITAPVAGQDDPEGWSLGLSLESGPILVSGGYAQSEDFLGIDLEGEAYSVGVQYVTGPWTVGASYFKASEETVPGGDENEFDVTEIGAQYALGEGVALFGVVELYRDDPFGPSNETDTDAFVVGMDLAF